MAMVADLFDVAASIAEYPYYRIGAAAACASACFYSFFYHLSSRWSGKVCSAYSRLSAADKVDWNTRLPSTVHALVVVALCLQALLFTDQFSDDPSHPTPVVFRVSATSYTILGTSAGYFSMDAFMMLRFKTLGTKELYIHHLVALLSLFVAAQVDCMHLYLLLVLLSEMTTPLVNLRWYMDKASLKHLQLYTVNGLLLLLTWGVARVLLFFPFYLHVLQHFGDVAKTPVHAMVLLLGVPLLLFMLNSMWFVKIAKGAWKLVFPAPAGPHQQQQPVGSKAAAATAAAATAGMVRLKAYTLGAHQMECGSVPHEE